MERLTNKKEADAQRKSYERRLKQGYPRNIPEERFLKLAAYEDAEEEGRLKVLPCKVGDAIFLIERRNILEEKVLGFIEAGCGLIMNVTYRDYVARPKCENVGKLLDDDHLSVFLSREEAEKELEGMNNG